MDTIPKLALIEPCLSFSYFDDSDVRSRGRYRMCITTIYEKPSTVRVNAQWYSATKRWWRAIRIMIAMDSGGNRLTTRRLCLCGTSNSMTSSVERTSAEAEGSRLLHREDTDGLYRLSPTLLRGGQSNPLLSSRRLSVAKGGFTGFEEAPC